MWVNGPESVMTPETLEHSGRGWQEPAREASAILEEAEQQSERLLQ